MKKNSFLMYFLFLSGIAFSESFSDDFESYSNLAKPTGSNSYFKWLDASYTEVSSNKAYSGEKSLQFFFKGDTNKDEDAWAEQRFELTSIKSELWIRYKLWIPENYFHRDGTAGDNNKGLILLWNGTYSGVAHTSVHFERPKDIDDSGESATNPGGSILYAAWKPNSSLAWNFYDQNNLGADWIHHSNTTQAIVAEDKGAWIDWVIYVKASTIPITSNNTTGEGNGVVRIWKNSKLIYNIWNATNYYEVPELNGWDKGYLLGWANSGFDEDTYFYIDDFKIGDSENDVDFELDSPVFGDVTKVIN